MPPIRSLVSLMPLVALALAGLAKGQEICSQRLLSETPTVDVGFGSTFDLSQDRVVVGAQFSTSAAGDGAVFVFDRTRGDRRFELTTVIRESSLGADSQLGALVAEDQGFIAAYAPVPPNNQGGTGVVIVYEITAVTTTEILRIEPTQAQGSVRSLKLEDGFMLVGFNASGDVYRLAPSGWELDETIVSSFSSADLDGPTLVSASGQIWRRDPFLQFWVLEGTVPGLFHSLHDDRLLVRISSSQLWLFERSTVTGAWSFVAGRTAAATILFAELHSGLSAATEAVSGGPLVRVCESSGASCQNSQIFSRGGLGVSALEFGSSVVMEDGLVGIQARDVAGTTFQESIELVELACDPISIRRCYQTEFNSTGRGGRVYAVGSDSIADNDVTLNVVMLPENSFGFFLNSRAGGNTVNPGGAFGSLCLAGNIGRFARAGEIMSSGTSGSFQLAIDLNDMPTPSGSTAVAPGETWYFQAWHRDQNPTLTSGFTDSCSVRFN